jgi:hypothetical protein
MNQEIYFQLFIENHKILKKFKKFHSSKSKIITSSDKKTLYFYFDTKLFSIATNDPKQYKVKKKTIILFANPLTFPMIRKIE